MDKVWDTASANELFTKISKTMPQTSPGALMANQYVDVIAHIFDLNGFPPGANELPADPAALADIQIVGKAGPMPAETGSLVRVIGWLA